MKLRYRPKRRLRCAPHDRVNATEEQIGTKSCRWACFIRGYYSCFTACGKKKRAKKLIPYDRRNAYGGYDDHCSRCEEKESDEARCVYIATHVLQHTELTTIAAGRQEKRGQEAQSTRPAKHLWCILILSLIAFRFATRVRLGVVLMISSSSWGLFFIPSFNVLRQSRDQSR